MVKVLTEVKINGINVDGSSLLSWKVEESAADSVSVGVVKCTKRVLTDVPNLRSGMSITIKRGITTPTDQFVFNGTIDRIDKQGANNIIYCKDKLAILINKSVTKVFDGIAFPSTEAKGSDIAYTLITDYGGLTASVVDTGVINTINRFICNGTDIYGRLLKLTEIYDYQLRYEASTDTVYFEPKGTTSNGSTLYVGGVNSNVNGIPKWVFDNTQLVNKYVVKGAVQSVQEIENFDGDASANQVFTVGFVPETVQVQEDIGGTLFLKIPGVENSTAGTFDYTVDKEQQQIIATTNWTPASGSENVIITYTRTIPIPILVSNPTSIGLYGEKRVEKFFSDIRDVEDAESRALGFINTYSSPFRSVAVKAVNLITYAAGQLVHITDTTNGEDVDLVINTVVKEYPHQYDVLELGDQEYRLAEWGNLTLERIRRLEEQLQGQSELLVEVNQFEESISIYRRYTTVRKKTVVSGQGFIMGSSNEGILGTSKLGNAFDSTDDNAPLQRLIWKEKTPIESFIDEDFKGLGTATWNLSSQQLEF